MEPSRAHRTGGNVWTACAHVITGVGGSTIVSLAFDMAHLGWVAGPLALLLSGYITYQAAAWLADCYRSQNPVTGKRSHRYKDVVNAWLGGKPSFACAWFQYSSLLATAIGCTITAGIRVGAIAPCVFHPIVRSNRTKCRNFYMIMFGALQLIFSQIPNLDKLWWVSAIATIVSFVYSTLLLVLGIVKLAGKGHMSGTVKGKSTEFGVFEVFASLRDIVFAYSFSVILVEVQGTLRASPAENKTMKRATLLAMMATTGGYLAIAGVQYATFGKDFIIAYEFAILYYACVVVHMIGAYQVFSQPIFECLEAWVSKIWPQASFTRPCTVLNGWLSFTLFRLVWRSLFVIIITVIAMVLPFFDDMLALLRALAFWPLTVYFPVEMYIRQAQIKRWSRKWICMELLSLFCFFVSIAAAMSSVQDILLAFRGRDPYYMNSYDPSRRFKAL